MKSGQNELNRRDFLKRASLGAGLAMMPGVLGAQTAAGRSANSRLQLAVVGCANRGSNLIIEAADVGVDFVALCDVDMARVAATRRNERRGERYSEIIDEANRRGVRWFSDYREMFTAMADKIDAVIIATPDHMHFPIAMTAINMGKHVYLEKPLTHTVDEARRLEAAAKAKGVITQMGNHGHSREGARLIREWVQAGVIGQVREVHSWTNRPVWPQGHGRPDHSQMIPVVPKSLHWDLWLGVAEARPYDPGYHPFRWRGYFDFGTGAFGDMACHIMDAAYWSLDLDYPERIEAATTAVDGYTFPSASVVTYQFGPRGSMPGLTYKWYDGGMMPSRPALVPASQAPQQINGTYIVGDEAVIYCDTYGGSVTILPDEKFTELKPTLPPRTIPRVRGSHMNNWITSIHENKPAVSDFSYAAPFTAMALLGNAAIRSGTALEYDARNNRFTNYTAANRYLSKELPSGWILS